MNIESLKYFHMIAKEGNISGVAKDVHLSQSALSQQLQKLENDLSKKLLMRSNKGVELTESGKVVFKFAENILRTYDKMMDELAETGKENIVVKIEACHFIANYALPCTLITANEKYPNHRYELIGNVSDEIINDVANNICDVGFSCNVQPVKSTAEVTAASAGSTNIVLVAKNDDSFPGEITSEQLVNSCLITFTDRNNITSLLMQNLKRLGHTPESLNCNLRVEGTESAKMLVLKKYGIAFLPYIAVKEELYKKQLKIIKVPDFDTNLDITMLYRTDCPQHVRDFVQWFKRYGPKSFC